MRDTLPPFVPCPEGRRYGLALYVHPHAIPYALNAVVMVLHCMFTRVPYLTP